MVYMGGSSKAKSNAMIQQNTMGGPSKAGLSTHLGHSVNVWFRLDRNTGIAGVFPIRTYGSTTKGMVGSRLI
jgi:hypothetical protein